MQSKNMIVATSHQQQQQQQTQQAQPQPQLKCPRCDSSNTKFCYYNNYSLSQPRHFCKACKRYWTRGGTLRNVPVGGSYRKNKRVKRPSTATTTTTAASTASTTTSSSPHQISHFSSMNHHPLFYGISDHMSSCNNLPMIPSRFSDSSKTSSSSGLGSEFLSSGFSSLSALGLGLPHHHMSHDQTINGSFINNSTTNKPFLLSGLFGSSMSSSSSTLLQHTHKPMNNGADMLGQSHLQTLASLQDLHVGGNNEDMNKEGKLDQISGNINGFMSSSSLDPSNYNNMWNASVVNGAWLDPTTNNVGSSLTSLI